LLVHTAQDMIEIMIILFITRKFEVYIVADVIFGFRR